MMLDIEKKEQVRALVNDSLNIAEHHWRNGGYQLNEIQNLGLEDVSKRFSDVAQSKIPGHQLLKDGETIIDEYIAFVADMRNSSKHLMCAISEKKADVTGLQRVFYETSALLPALDLTIKFEGGSVTEYLGDGVLALFRVDASAREVAIRSAYEAAKNVINDTRNIVNQEINKRYSLPCLDLGVGLSMSKTIVTLIGIEGNKHPKAFGECVFKATKLSSGNNAVLVDEKVWGHWPKQKNGSLIAKERRVGNVNGYLVYTK